MCGIVGIIAKQNVNVVAQVLSCIKKLEYRGYDSAGIAALHQQSGLKCLKIAGKVNDLITLEQQQPLSGNIAIAHTRWATHGEPSNNNAHPHISHHKIALVHNGIVENYEDLKTELLADGYTFTSETDTEVVAHLLYKNFTHESNFLIAVHKTISRLQGSFAVAIINSDEPDKIIVVRRGSPLLIGLGENINFISSDTLSLLEFTNRFIYLEEGDIATVASDKITLYNEALQPITRQPKTSKLISGTTIEKNGYAHYMLKEIYEQPQTIKDTLHISLENALHDIEQIAPKVKRVQIVACGSSYHAGMVAHYWCETLAKIPCHVEIASEFRYRDVVVEDNTLFITISQSGETADTLAALRWAKEQSYLNCLAICNKDESSLVRESDLSLMTHAGVEVGVASTKAVTAQLIALFLLLLTLAKAKNLTSTQYHEYIHQLKMLPIFAEQTLLLDHIIQNMAQKIVTKEHAFYLGRNINYPIALEGALKLKEISYFHAEAYPAGELKHGPLALIDDKTPVVVLAPQDKLWDKINSNMQEIITRGGELIVLTDNHTQVFPPQINTIKMPKTIPLLTPILYLLPLQLLAYYVAAARGTDIDQPRNLAKSVTVE